MYFFACWMGQHVGRNQRRFWQQLQNGKCHHPMQIPLLRPIIHRARYYDVEGGWEMPKVYTENYMKSNWSKTEMFKLSNKRSYMVRLKYQTGIWKLKSTGMWCSIPGQVVPGVAKYHSAFKMWGTTYPTLQHNILGDLICSNTSIQTPSLAHTNSCNCHVSMQSGCVWNV